MTPVCALFVGSVGHLLTDTSVLDASRHKRARRAAHLSSNERICRCHTQLTYEPLLRAGRDGLVRSVCALLILRLAFDGAVAALVGVRQGTGGGPALSGLTELRSVSGAAVLGQTRADVHLGDRAAHGRVAVVEQVQSSLAWKSLEVVVGVTRAGGPAPAAAVGHLRDGGLLGHRQLLRTAGAREDGLPHGRVSGRR